MNGLKINSVSVRPTSRASLVVARASSSEPSGSRRMGLIALTASVAGLVAQPVLAFGSGFPGYDMNFDARKRAEDRNRAEMQAEMKRAAEFRAAKKAKEAAAKEATTKEAPAAAAPAS